MKDLVPTVLEIAAICLLSYVASTQIHPVAGVMITCLWVGFIAGTQLVHRKAGHPGSKGKL